MTAKLPDDSLLKEAVALHRQGRSVAAGTLLRDILTRLPGHFDALHVLGLVEIQLGRPADALLVFERAAAIQPRHAMLNFNRGLLLQGLGRAAEALEAFELALNTDPAYSRALAGRANMLQVLGRLDEAEAGFASAIAAQPGDAALHLQQGNLFYRMARYENARSSFERALELQPGHADAHINLGCTLIKLSRHAQALQALDRAITLGGGLADVHFNRGIALAALSRDEDAVVSYGQALVLAPQLADAWRSRGTALTRLKRNSAALADFDQALRLAPGDAKTHAARAGALYEMGRVQEAIASYERALAIDPQLDFVFDAWLQARMRLCDWRDFDQNLALLEQSIGGPRMAAPTTLFALSNSAPLQRHCAEIYAASRYPAEALLPEPQGSQMGGRIRIGYFSADFFAHATAYLMAGLFEKHDKSRFEIFAFCFGSPSEDAMRQRLRGAFDRFIDVSGMTDHEVVRMARQLKIDIAVDLKGLTKGARPRIFAMRAAPVQVNFLGYPFTMGAPYVDYLIADKTLVADPAHYTEKILYMPHSYQPNDDARAIAQSAPSRAELGLPEQGFVFCCFNISYKITPSVFDVWMRLLARVENSVLWLIDGGDAACGNLRKEAQARGIAADRLVFAPRMEPADHLARHHAADLFLDTLPCNAHTTASDALWAGLPLLTCMGETLASRVSASLLNAVGLPELVTRTLEDYELIAFELATAPAKLAALRRRLAAHRLSHPLFDTSVFARHLEAGYGMMHDRLVAGLPPTHLFVDGTPAA
jgi:protein O-GlcNAc transferase